MIGGIGEKCAPSKMDTGTLLKMVSFLSSSTKLEIFISASWINIIGMCFYNKLDKHNLTIYDTPHTCHFLPSTAVIYVGLTQPDIRFCVFVRLFVCSFNLITL